VQTSKSAQIRRSGLHLMKKISERNRAGLWMAKKNAHLMRAWEGKSSRHERLIVNCLIQI
jgi:hypothetical protein